MASRDKPVSQARSARRAKRDGWSPAGLASERDVVRAADAVAAGPIVSALPSSEPRAREHGRFAALTPTQVEQARTRCRVSASWVHAGLTDYCVFTVCLGKAQSAWVLHSAASVSAPDKLYDTMCDAIDQLLGPGHRWY